MPKTLISTVFEVAKVAPARHPYPVLAKLQEEVGELATEVNISTGFLNKPAGKDGINGEAVDVIITALDMIFIDNPNVTEEEILELVQKKVNKWKSYLPNQ